MRVTCQPQVKKRVEATGGGLESELIAGPVFVSCQGALGKMISTDTQVRQDSTSTAGHALCVNCAVRFDHLRCEV